jgi:predicted deacylase
MRLLLLFLLAIALSAQQPFVFAGQEVAPGTRLDVDLPVAALGDPATVIPVSIFHGAQPGPVFALTCGVHGFEFIPILAAQQILQQLDPKQLRGTLILVRLAHLPAFERRSIFYNPIDGKNLNRVFPGSPLGTQSQRIAHLLSTAVIARADFHIDMHGGDGTESLHDFAGIYSGDLAAKQAAKSREIGLAFGLPTVVEYKVDTEEQLNTGRSCNRQAVASGIPTVLIEIGDSGRRDQGLVDLATRGVFNVLKSQSMLPGAPLNNKRMPIVYAGTISVSAAHSGIWYPRLRAGAIVRPGDTIGAIRDYQGKELESIRAPEEGFVLYMSAAPPVQAGQSVVTIARPPRAISPKR